jgi:tellurite resistance protein
VATARHQTASFRLDLRHPLLGPLTAYIPVIAILLVAHYSSSLGGAGQWLTYVAVLSLALNAAALVAHWLTATLDQDLVHPGYLLPVTAGPFIASIGLTSAGHHRAAMAAFATGAYFSLVLGAVITGRILVASPLPAAFKPVLSILVSPPATASVAWFAITDGRIDDIQIALVGITLSLLLVQVFLIPGYLALPFTAQHWVFTFPLAILGNIAVRWSAEAGGRGWAIVAWTVLGGTTGLILLIAAGTLRDLVRGSRCRALTSAD